jgi:hypothetical protein
VFALPVLRSKINHHGCGDRGLRGRVLEGSLGIWYNARNQVKRGDVNRRDFLIDSASAAALARCRSFCFANAGRGLRLGMAGYANKEYSADVMLADMRRLLELTLTQGGT